jgi:hypothetical protein
VSPSSLIRSIRNVFVDPAELRWVAIIALYLAQKKIPSYAELHETTHPNRALSFHRPTFALPP